MKNQTVRLYHGTLASHVPAILKHGIDKGEGWGGAGTTGVFLSSTPQGALYWAKMTWQREREEKIEEAKFDRAYGNKQDEILAVLVVDIPARSRGKLKADEEQFEDVQYPEDVEQDPDNWQASIEYIGDVRYDGRIPSTWIAGTVLPSSIRRA